MSQKVIDDPSDMNEVIEDVAARVEHLVTEDDMPVDNLFSEKQQRLLTEPLYSSWTPLPDPDNPTQPRSFLAAANVGIFPSLKQPPLVPDMFLSLDVRVPEDWHAKSGRSYFLWEFGKAPEVAVEIVSNRKGNELGSKLRDYARAGVIYYIVYDPTRQLGDEVLYVYQRQGTQYEPCASRDLPEVGLSLLLWRGSYEGKETTWLRWCDADDNVIPTGAERATREAERAERLAAKLRELGVDPEQL
jgi:Uma2 family endonuclease